MAAQLLHMDWLSGGVPDGVRAQLRRVVEVLGSMPRRQVFAVVTPDGVVLGVNEPLLDLVGRPADDLLESDWDEVMPEWEDHTASWTQVDQPDCHALEARLVCAGGREWWAHVVAVPVMALEDVPEGVEAPTALAAWTVFIGRHEAEAGTGVDLAACDECLCLFRSRGFSLSG
jgi:PAS domain-containing protein